MSFDPDAALFENANLARFLIKAGLTVAVAALVWHAINPKREYVPPGTLAVGPISGAETYDDQDA